MFSALEEAELVALMPLMQEHTFVNNQVVLQEGDFGDSIHVIIEGRARILTRDAHQHEMLLAEVGPGAFFGEISLLTGEPRSASVKATGTTKTLSLSHNDFWGFLERNSHACMSVITVLGHRLGRSSELLRLTARNANDIEQEQITTGQRIADGFTSVMGSWSFIIVQSLLLAAYVVWNLSAGTKHWDPYPFFLMALMLSFQAAYSAPIIMMSQNRQIAKDRLIAENIYQINVKASAEIGRILQRLDELEQHLSIKIKNESANQLKNDR